MFDQTLIRICLIFGSLVTAWYILRRVRQAKVQIEDTIFWLMFSAALLLQDRPRLTCGVLAVQVMVSVVYTWQYLHGWPIY